MGSASSSCACDIHLPYFQLTTMVELQKRGFPSCTYGKSLLFIPYSYSLSQQPTPPHTLQQAPVFIFETPRNPFQQTQTSLHTTPYYTPFPNPHHLLSLLHPSRSSNPPPICCCGCGLTTFGAGALGRPIPAPVFVDAVVAPQIP